MIVWSGWGLLVVILAIPASIAATIVGGVFNALVPLEKPLLASIIGAIWGVSWGVSCIVVGRRINDPQKDRLVVDPNTNQKILIKKRSTLFWIPIEYWGYPIIAVTVIFVAVTLWDHA